MCRYLQVYWPDFDGIHMTEVACVLQWMAQTAGTYSSEAYNHTRLVRECFTLSDTHNAGMAQCILRSMLLRHYYRPNTKHHSGGSARAESRALLLNQIKISRTCLFTRNYLKPPCSRPVWWLCWLCWMFCSLHCSRMPLTPRLVRQPLLSPRIASHHAFLLRLLHRPLPHRHPCCFPYLQLRPQTLASRL